MTDETCVHVHICIDVKKDNVYLAARPSYITYISTSLFSFFPFSPFYALKLIFIDINDM